MISKVYVLPDSQNRIIRIEGQYSLPSDLTDWVLIEEGPSCDRLNLAQSHYFPNGVYTEDGIPRYKLEGNIPVERTEEEIAADRTLAQPDTAPTLEDRILLLETENAQLKQDNANLNSELINTQLALCDIYERITQGE